jgi:hypothetical protein
LNVHQEKIAISPTANFFRLEQERESKIPKPEKELYEIFAEIIAWKLVQHMSGAVRLQIVLYMLSDWLESIKAWRWLMTKNPANTIKRVNPKKKKKLSREHLPHFQWELRSYQNRGEVLLKDYPMSGPRNSVVNAARLEALDVILCNITNGMSLIVPNFSRQKAEEHGFARSVFLSVLKHLSKVALIGREGEGYSRSIIDYSSRIRKYIPTRVIFRPLSEVVINPKCEGQSVMPRIDTEERRKLKADLKKVYDFYLDHTIEPGIDDETFKLFNDLDMEVYRKEPLIKPDPTKILPYIVFNDRDLTKGGRMYGAFWIGEKKVLRRAIKIDGELTADIDGRAMHVQLLYRLKGEHLPKGDPYLFRDDRRKIAKKLMLLMMNTRKECLPEAGREAVARTFRKDHGQFEGIEDLILQLEAHHSRIADEFYKPNWGRLQKTEAALMLSIMLSGIEDNIVVLPVHDGCLCPRQHSEKVLGYFKERHIEALENSDHRKPLPMEEARRLLKSAREFARQT